MYLGVDVGGTKTLLAVFTKDGKLKQSVKFPTPQNYSQFLDALTENIQALGVVDYQSACVALPGLVDREHGIGLRFGNLPWKNVHLVEFLEKYLKAPVLVENDAKLAGLYEATNVKDKHKRILYITISTGIGISLIIDGVIDTSLGDRGGNSFMLQNGKDTISWEKLASGKAITQKYGKQASEIDDPEIWKVISRDFAKGLIDVISLLEPDVVIIGGGVGSHFKKFGKFLKAELKKYEVPIMKIPPVLPAKRPEEAVIYGCYELLKARHG